MAAFPDIAPTSRTFEPGVYPQRTYRTLSGVVVRRTFGNSPFNAKLDMQFENIGDSAVESILNHYRTQTASNARFQVLTTTKPLTGMTSTLANLASGSTDNLRWEYAQPPQVRSIRSGLSTVSVSLLGEIRNPQQDD